MLVDKEKAVATAYDTLKENGGINRSVFLVDKAGIIRWVQAGTPSTEEILAAIDTL